MFPASQDSPEKPVFQGFGYWQWKRPSV